MLAANGSTLTVTRPVIFKDGDGVRCVQEVEFTIELAELAQRLGVRVCQGRSGRGDMNGGMIRAVRLGFAVPVKGGAL